MIKEIWQSKIGKISCALLMTLVLLSLYSVLVFPQNFGRAFWNNPGYWADNPKSAPPFWISLFDGDKKKHSVLENSRPKIINQDDSGKTELYQFRVKYSSNAPPDFLAFSISEILFYKEPPIIEVYLAGEDREVFLYRQIIPGKRPEESLPAYRYNNSPLRVLLTSEPEAKERVKDFFDGFDGQELQLTAKVYFADSEDEIRQVKFVFGGDIFGFLGTDHLGRDIFQGLLFGMPLALLIALTVSLSATFMGALLGGISGYFGGKIDTMIQRFIDVMANIPLLPILIFLVFVIGPHLLYIILFLVAFGWIGLAVQLRPWVLQIRESGFVEHSKAKGLSSWRIIFRHILPQTMPFLFANFIFSAPSAVLAEAGLSFLGLGDPSLPTWGQMLQQSYSTGAVYLGYWWQILPPGIAIVIVALTFFLFAAVLEPIVEPRLKKR